MKKILMCLAGLAIIACKEEPKDYVTFSGKITNPNSDSLYVFQGRNYNKTLKVNEDGTFNDTLKVNTGIYMIYDGNEQTAVYLKNGAEINMTIDTKQFDESVKFTGKGSESSNYLAEKALFQEDLINPGLFDYEKEEFTKEVEKIQSKMNSFLAEREAGLDSLLLANEKSTISQFTPGITGAYEQQKMQAEMRAKQFADLIGKPAPNFNFENVKGGKTTLADLKGKYTYIDVWATWCGPCIREIPYLKELEKDMHDKNIQFVSISVDDGRGYKNDAAAAREGWIKMVADKDLGGIQLLSDAGWKADFIQGFKINSIPRFLLLDPKGNVVDADAKRPSSPKLKEYLNGLENM
ncbi:MULTISPECIES: TlpA family protein disulfide reductase [Mesoflavibacter]|uniref:TlpA family protein disulfide reductase n=1 Tax=Mesoflavibacter profundi TaxID=2708110 RepID=A0ABT4RXI0_9FLAO|nr:MULTISPECIES: TlpA disulfide reductase family protein [Mesoflavibacter]MDA0176524.1 TlpA family protein disulfide reductase [Mesoflavibacter profundi]